LRDPVYRIAFRLCSPNFGGGKLGLQILGQFFHGEALRGIVTGQDKGETVALRGKAIMKPCFSGQEHVRPCVDGITKESAAGATDDGHALHPPVQVTHHLHRGGM
jgi:hypothetical protein